MTGRTSLDSMWAVNPVCFFGADNQCCRLGGRHPPEAGERSRLFPDGGCGGEVASLNKTRRNEE